MEYEYTYRGIEYLRRKLEHKRVRVQLRYRYYDAKERSQDKALLAPPWMKDLYRSVVGWCAKGVDSLADRLVFDGFENDYFNAMQIFDMNNPDVFFDSAIRESMIASCAFVHITHGDNGERTPKLSVLTADDATGVIDEFTGLLKEGYAVLDRDDNGRPLLEAYFTREGTQYLLKGEEIAYEANPARYPLLVPVIYRPTSKRPFGHSRISRACMSHQDMAKATIQRSEISAEFYCFPQKWVSGLDPDTEPMDTWRASMSAMLRFDKDEDGDHPVIGQFNQQSMAPYMDMLKTAAALMCGETGLTMDDLGFPTENPSSAEAIKASHESLRLVARKAQRTYGVAFANVGYIAASLRDETPYSRTLIADIKPIWLPVFEPDASMLSTVGDGAIKINQAVPDFFTKDNLRILTGIEPAGSEPVGVEEAAE